MSLATVSADGQITVPPEIRRLLRLQPGDTLALVPRANGDVVMSRADAAQSSLAAAQRAFAGTAPDFGVTCDDDDAALIADLLRRR